MARIVFLVEEFSMKEMLRGFLPRLFPEWKEGPQWLCIRHEGKNDLLKSIPRKLKTWKEPGIRFVILHDQDQEDCKKLKAKLQQLCTESGRSDTLIRIPCRELESWYLGDLAAVEKGLKVSGLVGLQYNKKFRAPDALNEPDEELARGVKHYTKKSYSKTAGSRAISPQLHPERNQSHSFRVFVKGLKNLNKRSQKP